MGNTEQLNEGGWDPSEPCPGLRADSTGNSLESLPGTLTHIMAGLHDLSQMLLKRHLQGQWEFCEAAGSVMASSFLEDHLAIRSWADHPSSRSPP